MTRVVCTSGYFNKFNYPLSVFENRMYTQVIFKRCYLYTLKTKRYFPVTLHTPKTSYRVIYK